MLPTIKPLYFLLHIDRKRWTGAS